MGGFQVDRVDVVVIGAGVVGLAVARALALRGREVLVIEAAEGIGTGTSSRNSEVIHAGIYYPAGSLKARLCVQGRQMLYAYCTERGIPHRRCGKLIVATEEDQVSKLQAIQAAATRNGVTDLRALTRDEALALEPQLQCHSALLSPSTGIVDSHAFMLALQGDLEAAGGLVAFNSKVNRLVASDPSINNAIVVIADDGTTLAASVVVNAAGHGAPVLAAHTEGLAASHRPRAWACKGNYFTLTGRAPFSRLIYPVPNNAGLGVHITLDMGGQAKFGPDVQWVDSPDDLLVDPRRGDSFYAEIRRYWPALPDGALAPGYAGMRPKISGPSDPAADFRIDGPEVHGIAGLVNLFGIESPGLTSALALGEDVAARLA